MSPPCYRVQLRIIKLPHLKVNNREHTQTMSIPQKLLIDSIELRLAKYPWYVSRCGKYAVDHRRKHVLRRYTTPGRKARILMTPSGPSMHRMVGSAWVYNPAPGLFSIIDHIDGNVHNNDASNLRWVNCSLNNLNRIRLPWVRVKYLKKLKHRVAVHPVSLAFRLE